MITVVNKHKPYMFCASVVTTTIYCGRGSALGNPFIMKDPHDRDRVCDEFIDWFPAIINWPSRKAVDMRHQLFEIKQAADKGDVHLECFCAPLRCHCDTIKAYVEQM